jgi:hypothetical protein
MHFTSRDPLPDDHHIKIRKLFTKNTVFKFDKRFGFV